MRPCRMAAGAALVIVTAVAIGATALPATASTWSQDIRRRHAPARPSRLRRGEQRGLLRGTGELPVQFHGVYKITTGENTGCFSVILHGAVAASNVISHGALTRPNAAPRHIIRFPHHRRRRH